MQFVATSPDRAFVAVSDPEIPHVLVWKLETLSIVARCADVGGFALAFRDNERLLIARPGELIEWTIATGARRTIAIPLFFEHVTGLDLLPDRQGMYLLDDDADAWFAFDFETGALAPIGDPSLRGVEQDLPPEVEHRRPDGMRRTREVEAPSGPRGDATIDGWSVIGRWGELGGEPYSVVGLTDDGEIAAVRGNVVTYFGATPRQVTIDLDAIHLPVTIAALSPNAQLAFTIGPGGVWIADLADGAALCPLDAEMRLFESRHRSLHVVERAPRVITEDGINIRVLDVVTGESLAWWQEDLIDHLALSQDDAHVRIDLNKGGELVLDATTLEPTTRAFAPRAAMGDEVIASKASPSGRTMVIATRRGLVLALAR